MSTNERSWRLRPFAPAGKYTPIEVSYTYPADYGAKMNSVGWIGDKSLAGTTVDQYGAGEVLDCHQPLYLLTDRDIQTLLHWMPDGWSLPKLRGILLVDFRCTATDLPTLIWPDIIAMLNTRSPLGDDTLWANARWIAENCTVTSDSLRQRVRRQEDILTRSPKGQQKEYYLPDVERAFPTKAAGIVKKFRREI